MFASNTSEMKRVAARDFEDILQVNIPFSYIQLTDVSLQCAIPVFEGLFPTAHDTTMQTLLYRFAQWHALAKLRIHSESTLDFLEETFKILSRQLRKFRDTTCTAFNTVELPKEKAARRRRFTQGTEPHGVALESNGPRTRRFNMSTYKFHAMGDYVPTIKLFGTTDSFTTQTVSFIFFVKFKDLCCSIGRTRSPSLEVILSTNLQARHTSTASQT